jgi:hypothetical protein
MARNKTSAARDQVNSEFAGSSSFVVKDPRMSCVLPLWMDVVQALGFDVADWSS